MEAANAKRAESKARFAILRRALLASINAEPPEGEGASQHSIHRHDGYSMFDRSEQDWCPLVVCTMGSSSPSSHLLDCIRDSLDRLGAQQLLVACIAEKEDDADRCRAVCEEALGGHFASIKAIKALVPETLRNQSNRFMECMHIVPITPLAPVQGKAGEHWRLAIYSMQLGGPRTSSQTRERSTEAEAEAVAVAAAPKVVMTRERPKGLPRISLEGIFSHKLHGVDNTGNVRVWAAEQVMLHTLLMEQSTPQDKRILGIDLDDARVLELGGGMTGLAGLGIAVCTSAREVVITDGNPTAVLGQHAGLEANKHSGAFGSTMVACRRLMWSKDHEELAENKAALGSFDVIMGADCLFFVEFHTELLATLHSLLAERGVVVLCQPTRGGSMQLFSERAAAAGFTVQTVEAYSNRVEALHAEYQQDSSYDVDLHYPRLLLLARAPKLPLPPSM
ncbi:unnamed protein product [Chrysoparadoxa australica]